jgi:carbon-monoxide dehydrogenase small subunit
LRLTLTVDGALRSLETPPERRLLDILREDLGLTAAKPGCGIGRCGACTVLLDGRPVNACLVPAFRLKGTAVVTRDALPTAALVPVIEALEAADAFQCGYCAPGFLVALAWLHARDPRPDAEEAMAALSGHLCRCTGYGGIRRAVRALFGPR